MAEEEAKNRKKEGYLMHTAQNLTVLPDSIED